MWFNDLDLSTEEYVPLLNYLEGLENVRRLGPTRVYNVSYSVYSFPVSKGDDKYFVTEHRHRVSLTFNNESSRAQDEKRISKILGLEELQDESESD